MGTIAESVDITLSLSRTLAIDVHLCLCCIEVSLSYTEEEEVDVDIIAVVRSTTIRIVVIPLWCCNTLDELIVSTNLQSTIAVTVAFTPKDSTVVNVHSTNFFCRLVHYYRRIGEELLYELWTNTHT